jgi:hypothetical protein
VTVHATTWPDSVEIPRGDSGFISVAISNTSTVIESDSTLRFRTLDELESSLSQAGFVIDQVRDAPDRPSREFVVIASPSRH